MWQRMLFTGALFGVPMFVVGYANSPDDLPAGARVGVAAVGAVVGGTLFGLFRGWFSARQDTELRQATEGTSPTEEHLAIRAAWRGPVPSDPVVRRAALRIAEGQRRQTRAWWWPSVVLWLALTALGISLAVSGSPAGWTTVVFLGFLMFQLWLSRRLAQRAALLAGDGLSPTQ